MKTIKTDRLNLRILSLDDADRLEELASDYDVAKTTLNIPHPYPKGSAKQFISHVLKGEQEGKIAIFAVIEESSSNLIGILSIGINITHRRGELAYWIGKPYWRQGYGTEAVRATLKHAFEELKLNKIFAQEYSDNPGSWLIMEKIGMKSEGILRQHIIKWGEYKDLKNYAILKEEYCAQTGS